MVNGALDRQLELFADLPPPVRRVPNRDQLVEKAEALAFRVSRELGIPVSLSVTDNRATMVSFRRRAEALALRVHHMFLDAPANVVQAVADYAGRGRGRAGRVLDDFIRQQQGRIRRDRSPRDAELVPDGRIYDLSAIFEELNQRFFQGRIDAAIGWGRNPGKRRRRSIRLGVYDHQTREIRIHPALDSADVPRYFVEFIVFHEMLHQLFPSSDPDGDSGRRSHHPRAFRDREKSFPGYRAALQWERQNLKLLLTR